MSTIAIVVVLPPLPTKIVTPIVFRQFCPQISGNFTVKNYLICFDISVQWFDVDIICEVNEKFFFSSSYDY